ncbi:RidA family protein [Streptomyces sp. NPDC059556]|uniref:RidA family protein n=1 Tax=Streptomyces sp. NPDC059556 TaxID=3346863 RepID=UPI0036B8FD13
MTLGIFTAMTAELLPVGLLTPAAADLAARVLLGIAIGGQYASDASGAPVPADFAAQVELSLVNLKRALEGVGLGLEHVVRLGSHIVDHDLAKLEALGEGLHAHFGERLPAQTLSGVAALALPGMLFEIDAVAVRPAA